MTKTLVALRGSTHFEDAYGMRTFPSGRKDRMDIWSIDYQHHVLTVAEGKRWISAFFDKLDILSHDAGVPMSNEIAFEVYDDE